LKCSFIRTARYVDWLVNIVRVVKKTRTHRVCIDFRDLNQATLKDEYHMPVVEILVDSAAGFEYLSMFHHFIRKFMHVYIDDIVVKSSAEKII